MATKEERSMIYWLCIIRISADEEYRDGWNHI